MTRRDPLEMCKNQHQSPPETLFLSQGYRWGWDFVTPMTHCDPLGVCEKQHKWPPETFFLSQGDYAGWGV